MLDYWDNFSVKDRENPDLGGNLFHGDTQSITPGLWQMLIDRFAPRSVLDIGAGEGHAASFFHRRGIVVHGIDGLMRNVLSSRFPIALHDLKNGPYIYPCDLAYCVEVAEHISEEFVTNLIETLCNAPVIVMTHGLPGQKGHHHVNNQPSEYWINQLQARNYMLSRDNQIFREFALDENKDCYFSNSGLIFLKTL